MAELVGLDWPSYVRTLQADEIRILATWLRDLGLQVGEFMEVVDRAWAKQHEPRRERPREFMSRVGRRIALTYALRKRSFVRLMALREEALLSGALPGDVAPWELDLPVAIHTQPRPVDELQAALERVGRDRA